jgi:hypothetical protein
MYQSRNNYPPGGEALFNIVDVIGPLDRDSLIKTMVAFGASKNEFQAGLTVKNMIKMDQLYEEDESGKMYLPTHGCRKAPFAKLLSYTVRKLSNGRMALLTFSKVPAILSFTTDSADTVYECAIFAPSDMDSIKDYLEYRSLSRIITPVILLIQKEDDVPNATAVEELFEVRDNIVIAVFIKGAPPMFFQHGRQILQEEKIPEESEK